MALDAPSELELEQHLADHGGRGAGEAHEVVEADRGRPEQAGDVGAGVPVRLDGGLSRLRYIPKSRISTLAGSLPSDASRNGSGI